MSIELRNVSVSAGQRYLVDGVSLDVEPGTWTTVVGPNGAGKTTLINVMSGLCRPKSGDVTISGDDVFSMSERERARRVAVVPQHPVMPQGLTVRDYIGLGRTSYSGTLRSPSRMDIAIVESVLDRITLHELRDRDVASLSGGERQRAVVGRALAQSTMVLILDEPTTGLDVRHQMELLALVEKEVRECGLTVVATLHDLTLAAQHTQHLVVMNNGRVVIEGATPVVMQSEELAKSFGVEFRIIDVAGAQVVVPLHN
jgi:iron complex transport system ATP-binding protein